jgi:DNA polymerase (family X)
LSELPGIGKNLSAKIADIVKTGHFALLDTLSGELGDMAALPGLGPKRVKLLRDKLHVVPSMTSAACSEGDAYAKSRGSVPSLQGSYRTHSKSGRIGVAGSYRRRRDKVGDLDVLVTAKDGTAIVDIRAVPEEGYGAALLFFTESKAHNIALRGLPSSMTGSSMNTVCFRASVGSLASPRKWFTRSSASLLHPAGTARGPRRGCARHG